MEYELCRKCIAMEDHRIYCLQSLNHLIFNYFSAETYDSSQVYFNCVSCGSEIARLPDFLDALDKRNVDYVETVISSIDNLSNEAKELLREGMMSFSVPSFVFRVDIKKKDILRELAMAGYVDYLIIQYSTEVKVFLDVFRLGIFSREDILSKMDTQRNLYQNPGWFARLQSTKNSKHIELRKSRIEDLPYLYNNLVKQSILDRFEGKCAFTGRDDVKLHIDHVIPVKSGFGGTIMENLLPIWQRINSSKNDKNVFEWYEANGNRFGVCPDRFIAAITYIADLNDMTYEEYKEYVYKCHEGE